jgi:hypothetical protein
MTESRSHGPGHEPNEGGIRQHQHMARGDKMPGGDFGVSEYPGRARREHPEGPPNAEMLSDKERTPGISMGKGKMGAQAHPHMGHHHHHER